MDQRKPKQRQLIVSVSWTQDEGDFVRLKNLQSSNSENSEHSIGLSSNSAPTIMRVPFKGLAACAAAFFLVIASVDCVNAENEQHLYYKEYERLQKQVKPVNYNLQDLSNNQHSTNRRIPNYQHPQFSNPNFPSRTYGVQQQEQRQEHPIHEPNQRVLQIENTKYSVWSQNMSYKSSVGYNPLGMGQLYNLTNQAIDLFVDKKEPIPNGNIPALKLDSLQYANIIAWQARV